MIIKTLYNVNYYNILIKFIFFFLLLLFTYPLFILFLENNFQVKDKESNFLFSINERYFKFFLLDNNKNADTFVLGTSTATLLNPNNSKNSNGINLAFAGADSYEYEKIINWIVKKRKPKKIFLALKYYNFQEQKLNRYLPASLEINNVDKIINTYNIELFKIYKNYIINSFISKIYKKDINYQLNEKLLSVGLRKWSDYLKISFINHKIIQEELFEEKARNNIVKNSNVYLYNNNISLNKLRDFERIINLCIKNNIELVVFFDPSYINYLNKNNFLIVKQDIKIISFLLENTNLQKIYYYNNFSKLNLEEKPYFIDTIHYDYSTSNLLIEDLNDQSKLATIITKNNLKEKIAFLQSKIKYYEK